MNALIQLVLQTFSRPSTGGKERHILIRYPVLVVTCLLITGFVLGEHLVVPSKYTLLTVLITLLLMVLMYRYQTVFYLAFVILWVAAGSFFFSLVYQIPLDRLAVKSGSVVTLEGYLEREGSRLFLRGIRGFPGYAPGLMVREGRESRILSTETNVRLTGRYQLINSCANPGVADLFDLWWKRRVFGEITVDSLVDLGQRSVFRSMILGFQGVRERFFSGWERDLGEAYPFFAALVWGERGEAFYQHLEVLKRSGIYHAFCVSGLHMALFGSLVLLLFHLFVPLKRWSWLPAIGFSFGYLVFCGFSPSAFRAWLMFALYLTGKQMGRNTTGIHLLFLAFLFMFFIQPETVFQPGAQLSFSATAGILLVSGIADRFTAHGPWLFRYLKGSMIMTMGVVSTSLPVLIIHGFSFSSLAFLGNAILMPVLQITIGFTFIGSLVGINQWLRMLVAPVIRALLSLSLIIANWLVEQVPHLFWDFTTRVSRWKGLLIWAVMIAFLLLLAYNRRVEKQCIVLVALGVCFFLLLAIQPQPLFEFWVLDVGQGLATSAILGDRSVVFDSGGIIRNYGNIGTTVLNPFLHYQGVERIDAIFITHPHLDHQAGTAPLAEEFPVDAVFYRKNGAPLQADHVMAIEDPARFSFGNRVMVEVFPVDGPKENDQALVFRVHFPGFTILVSGDIEEEGMRQLFRYGGHNLAADIVVMPHHGHYTPTLRELLLLSGCSFAIISVGENRYGHPDPRTLALLDELRITTFTTGRDGGIRIVPGLNEWRIESFGKAAVFTMD